MGKRQPTIAAKSPKQLARLLGLVSGEETEFDFRAQLNLKIIEVVENRQISHEKVAKLARTSRTRVTAILNGNTSGISTDLMLRILYSLGYRVKARFSPFRIAA